jgi:alpha-L-rhamnosidase
MIFSEKFISATPAFEYETYEKIVPAPYMRKSFELEKAPGKAEITVTGLGFYKLFVNGKDITKGLLAPYISNSDQTVYYDNYDIFYYTYECDGLHIVWIENTETLMNKARLIDKYNYKGIFIRDVPLALDGNWEALYKTKKD